MKTALTACAALALALAASAGAAPTKWYWTTAQANTIVMAKVKIPYCHAVPTSTYCSDGKPIPGGPADGFSIGLGDVICKGTGAATAGGRFHTFICNYSVVNDRAEGNLAITVIGKTAFRWKLL